MGDWLRRAPLIRYVWAPTDCALYPNQCDCPRVAHVLSLSLHGEAPGLVGQHLIQKNPQVGQSVAADDEGHPDGRLRVRHHLRRARTRGRQSTPLVRATEGFVF